MSGWTSPDGYRSFSLSSFIVKPIHTQKLKLWELFGVWPRDTFTGTSGIETPVLIEGQPCCPTVNQRAVFSMSYLDLEL